MEKQGKEFPDWYIMFQQAVVAALPRPPELEQEVGLKWARSEEDLTKILADALLPKQEELASTPTAAVRAYPVGGEIFELALDGDAPENDPLEMVRRDGYDPEGWKHTGEKVTGKQTRRFKLVCVGYCHNLDEVRQRLQQHGAIPEGQWREAFKTAYPQPDGNGSIGFADSSWVHPNGRTIFPCVGTLGGSGFNWAGGESNESWRWLVEVK